MLAIIPARAGSKRLPGKNIKDLGGKPLIHHTLEAAVAAKKVTRVIFNTDSKEFRDIALQVEGVEAPFLRPPELATDMASASDLHIHTRDWFKENEGIDYETFCIFLPTCPLRLPSDIDAAIELYEERNADIVTSVTRAKPLAWHLNMDDESGNMNPILDGGSMANYQEMPAPPVHLNGAIYVIRSAPYRKSRSYFGPKTYGYEMPAARSIDIDEPKDFELAEAIYAYQNKAA